MEREIRKRIDDYQQKFEEYETKQEMLEAVLTNNLRQLEEMASNYENSGVVDKAKELRTLLKILRTNMKT
jgi:hypothetical protein